MYNGCWVGGTHRPLHQIDPDSQHDRRKLAPWKCTSDHPYNIVMAESTGQLPCTCDHQPSSTPRDTCKSCPQDLVNRCDCILHCLWNSCCFLYNTPTHCQTRNPKIHQRFIGSERVFYKLFTNTLSSKDEDASNKLDSSSIWLLSVNEALSNW